MRAVLRTRAMISRAAPKAPSASRPVVSRIDGVLRRPQGRGAARHVALVAPADVGEDRLELGEFVAREKLAVSPARALLRRRRDEQLGVGCRADDRADVAPVEHGAAGLRGEPALQVEQGVAHGLVRGHDRGGIADLAPLQARIVEAGDVEDLGGARRGGHVAERQAGIEKAQRHGPVEEARVEMRQAEMLGEPLAEGALAGARPARRWR